MSVSGQCGGASAVSLGCIRLGFFPTPPPIISVAGAWFHLPGDSWLEGAGLPAIKGVTLSVFAKSGSPWTFQARAYTLRRSCSTKYNQNSRKSVWRICKWKSSGPGENDRENGMDLDLENCAYLGQISRSAINYRGMPFRATNFFPSALQVDWNTQHQKN